MTEAPLPSGGDHRSTKIAIGLLIGVMAAIGVYALTMHGEETATPDLDDSYQYDPHRYDGPEPPRPVGWQQVDELPAGLETPRAIACASDSDRAGQIWIAGDQAVRVIDRSGQELARYALDFEPGCVAVVTDGILVADRQHVWFLPDEGERRLVVDLGDGAWITAMTKLSGRWYVADARGKAVHRINPVTGQVEKTVGGNTSQQGDTRFTVPSPYFDMVAGESGLLWVVNPGRLHVEAFTRDLDWEQPLTWGTAGTRAEDFIGCCNPAHLAQLPNGTFVTSEKGTRRIKFYRNNNEFDSILAGPTDLGEGTLPLDLACDAVGRVYALDLDRKTVRVFSISARRPRP